MKTLCMLRAGWPALFLLPALAGQDPAPIDATGLLGRDFVAPLQRHDLDPNAPLWSAGETWKARFDDAFTFFPWLGADAERTSGWSWRTTALHGGGTEVTFASDDATLARRSDTVVEFARGPMVERYEMLPEGVAQSFHFAAPIGGGDLVVRGCLDAAFRGPLPTTGHGALVFTDARGRDALRYGEAFALDAAGRKLPIQTAWDGEGIELRVPAAWLAEAAWPVAIDPLITSVVLRGFPDARQFRSLALGRDDDHDERMTALTRQFAIGDHDLYVILSSDTFVGSATVFSDLADDHDTAEASVDYVAGADRWTVAYDDDFAGRSRLRVYVRDGGVGTGANGVVVSRDSPTLDFRSPSIGGRADNGDTALIAWQGDPIAASGNSQDSRVLVCTFDAQARTFGFASFLKASVNPNYDAERPCVSRGSRGGDGWMVVWQEYDPANANDDWDVIGQRVRGDGGLGEWEVFGPSSDPSLHKLRPVVAGTGGRFLVAYSLRTSFGGPTSATTGQQIQAQVFLWSENAQAPTKRPTVAVATAPSLDLSAAGVGSIDYDTLTDSHWALGWLDRTGVLAVSRLGYDGRPVETVVIDSATDGGGVTPVQSLAAVCFDDDARRFGIASHYPGSVSQAIGRQFTYAAAQVVNAGSSCAGTMGAANRGGGDAPHLGSEFFRVFLSNGRPNVPTWMIVGLGPADLPLPGGAAGCRVLVDGSIALIVLAAGSSSASGEFNADLPLPGSLPPINLFAQSVQLDQGLFWTSDRLAVEIR